MIKNSRSILKLQDHKRKLLVKKRNEQWKVIFLKLQQHMEIYKSFYIILFLLSILFFYFNVFSPIFPLNVDEVWPYLTVGSFGPFAVATHYNCLSVHVFYTILQSIFVPKSLLKEFPYLILIINCFAVIGLFATMAFFSNKFLNKKIFTWVIVILTCIFLSPYVTPYFFVGRGYITGALFLLWGIYFMSQEKTKLGIVFLVMCGYTIPTYIYYLPLVFLVLFFYVSPLSRKKILKSAFIVIVALILLYLPIIKSMMLQADITPSKELFQQKTNFISNFPYVKINNFPYPVAFDFLLKILSTSYLFAYLLSLITLIVIKTEKKLKLFTILLSSAVVSFITVVLFFSFTHIALAPFLRNAFSVPLFIAMTIWFCAFTVKRKLFKIFLLVMLLFNIAAGIYNLTPTLFEEEFSYPNYYFDKFNKEMYNDLREGKLNAVTTISEYDMYAMYFSWIYSLPRKIVDAKNNEIVIKSFPPFEPALAPISLPVRFPIIPTLGSSIGTLKIPTVDIYALNKKLIPKLKERILLALIDIVPLPKVKIHILVFLSNEYYIEAENSWKNGKHNESIISLLKGEDYISAISRSDLLKKCERDKNLNLQIASTTNNHLQFLERIIREKKIRNDKILKEVLFFCKYNRQILLNRNP